MARQGQQQLLFGDAHTVIHDANLLDAALQKLHGNFLCTGIDTIFQNLLERRSRAFDHFTGGDLVNQ